MSINPEWFMNIPQDDDLVFGMEIAPPEDAVAPRKNPCLAMGSMIPLAKITNQ